MFSIPWARLPAPVPLFSMMSFIQFPWPRGIGSSFRLPPPTPPWTTVVFIFRRFYGAGIHSPGAGPPRGHFPPRCWGGLMRVPDARDPFRAPLPPLLPVGAHRRTCGGSFLLDTPRGPRSLFFQSSCACAVPSQPQTLKTDRQGLFQGLAIISTAPEFCPGLRDLLSRPAFSRHLTPSIMVPE